MAVTDSADTVVKAADARRAMEQAPETSTAFMQNLVDREGLKALAVFHLNNGRRANWVTFSWDGASLEIIADWARNTRDHALPPEVADRQGAVIVAVRRDGVIDMASWGKTQADCGACASWGEVLMESLPAAPFQTWFGWGNGGVPRRLEPKAVATLSEAGKAFVARNTHPDA